MTDFSLETMKSRRKWSAFFKMLKEEAVDGYAGEPSFQK